jgi:hypothetical protein
MITADLISDLERACQEAQCPHPILQIGLLQVVSRVHLVSLSRLSILVFKMMDVVGAIGEDSVT